VKYSNLEKPLILWLNVLSELQHICLYLKVLVFLFEVPGANEDTLLKDLCVSLAHIHMLLLNRLKHFKASLIFELYLKGFKITLPNCELLYFCPNSVDQCQMFKLAILVALFEDDFAAVSKMDEK
jgi:hypothetical protein